MRKALTCLLLLAAVLAIARANAVDDLDEALREGKLTIIQQAVKKNPALVKMKMSEEGPGKGDTMLSRAAFWGQLDIVKFLVQKGSDVNHHGFTDSTPLEKAAFMGHPEVVKYLIGVKADLNSKGNIGGTPLHAAIFGNQVECVKLLVNAGANLEARDNLDDTPLFKAAEEGNAEIVQILLKKGANPNAKGFMGKTVLAATKDPACRKLLQKAGAK